MSKTNLLKLLKEIFPICITYNEDAKTIYFRDNNKKLINIKCYTYHDGDFLENDSCIWYFIIQEGGYNEEYLIPSENTKAYIELVKKRYLEYYLAKNELEEKLQKLRKLRKGNCKSDIRNYKLNNLLNG